MDDDLLADDGQYKDDGLEDLDIDEEAALLGASDDEDDSQVNSVRRRKNDILEYIDEEGNPVEIGENNAGMYEYADYGGNGNQNQLDDDVLEVDVDELESFSENLDSENIEIPQRASVPKETRYKENLISVQLIPNSVTRHAKDGAVVHSQENRQELEENPLFSPSDGDAEESFSRRFEIEEESEEENVDDDHRDRFKSERSNIITLTPAKKRAHIPDTLESVISVEETAKINAFMANEQQKKKNFKFRNRGQGRGRINSYSFRERSKLSYGNNHCMSQSLPQNVAFSPQVQRLKPSQEPIPRKILINPHFRGPRHASTVSGRGHMQQNQVNYIPCSVPPTYNQPYASNSFGQSADYHHDQYSVQNKYPQSSNEPVPVFREPIHALNSLEHHHPPPHQFAQIPPSVHSNFGPPPVPYHPNEMPPPPLQGTNAPVVERPQPPSEIWMTPPNMISPTPFHPTPLPGPHFQDPPPGLCPSTSMSNFSYNMSISTFGNSNFQNQQAPVSQPVSYHPHQPPPTHQPPPLHFNPMNSSTPRQPVVHQSPQSINNQQMRKIPVSKINTNVKVQPKLRQFNQAQNLTYARRQVEKRPAMSSLKTVSIKMPRCDNNQRKSNIQIRTTSPNIKEITLVETLPPPQKIEEAKSDLAKEEEKKKDQELMMQIEEQRLRREALWKNKEERRRQMAAQRLQDLNKRKGITNFENASAVSTVAASLGSVQTKVSVKQRIGLPLDNVVHNQNAGIGKKKVVVVRKKVGVSPPITQNSVDGQQKAVSVLQRLGPRPFKKKAQVQKSNMNVQRKNLAVQKVPTKSNVLLKITGKPEVEVNKSNNVKVQSDLPVTSGEAKVETKPNPPLSNDQNPKSSSPLVPVTKPLKVKLQVRNSPKPNRLRINFQNQRSPNISRNCMQSLRFPNPRSMAPPPFQMPGLPNQVQAGPPIQIQRGPFVPFDNGGPRGFAGQERMQSPRFFCQGPPNDNFNQPRMLNPPGFQNWGFRGEDLHGPRIFPPNFHNQRLPFHMQDQQVRHQPFPNRRPPGPNFGGQAMQGRRFRNQSQLKSNNSSSSIRTQNTISLKPKPIVNQQADVIKSAPATELSEVPSKNDKLSNEKAIQDKSPASSVISEEKQPEANVNCVKSQSVVIENLSASTNDIQLKKMCIQVGPIEKLQLLAAERKAIIKFKNGVHAADFQKKYQRFMLDLAMIQVSLLPP